MSEGRARRGGALGGCFVAAFRWALCTGGENLLGAWSASESTIVTIGFALGIACQMVLAGLFVRLRPGCLQEQPPGE